MMLSSSHIPVLCVTNRALCQGDFLEQIERVVAMRPAGVLLREKDLDEAAYSALAREVARICAAGSVPLVVHSHARVARELACRYLHLTLPALEKLALADAISTGALPEGLASAGLNPAVSNAVRSATLSLARLREEFELSTSCHSVEEAQRAEALGCTRIIAGHVYETNSKPGLPPRGLSFLQQVCAAVTVPVWAIGGVTPDRLDELAAAGAAGACMMSPFMLANRDFADAAPFRFA